MLNSLGFFVAISVITASASWNQFPLAARRWAGTGHVDGAGVALSTLMTAQTISLHQVFMAALILIVPQVLVFDFLQRYLVQGVAEAGIKG